MAGRVVTLVRRVAVGAGMVVVITLMLWAGVHNYRSRQLAMQQARRNVVTLTKDSGGGGFPEPAGGMLRGKAAPGFSLVSLEGKKVSLADFKGKPVMVNFWATWCAPCRLEMPWIEEFSAKYKDQGLTVLGISEDDAAPKEEIAKAARKSGVTYPILLTDGKVSKAYGGVDNLPETFYVDRNGKVVDDTAGLPTKDEMEANIRRAIAAGGQ